MRYSSWRADGWIFPALLIYFRGSKLATSSGDTTVKIWDFSKAECVHTFTDHTHAGKFMSSLLHIPINVMFEQVSFSPLGMSKNIFLFFTRVLTMLLIHHMMSSAWLRMVT